MTTDRVEQDIGIQEVQLAHTPRSVKIVAGQPVGCSEGRDALAKGSL
jgi:hypothetical protein